MSNNPDVLVIGGGIIGTACASELCCRGASVTLVERGQVGHGCSYGNAGWITPSHCFPLPMPGMFFQSLKWLFDPQSPLYIKPRLNGQWVRWLIRFIRCMNQRRARPATKALSQLACYSLDAYRSMDQEKPGLFGFTERGCLVVTRSARGLKEALRELEWVKACGRSGLALDAAGVRDLEPAIAATDVAGGGFYPNEASAEPFAAVQMMAARAREQGATILSQTEVFDFVCRGGKIRTVRTTRGDLVAGQVVLAAGFWSNQIGSRLGQRVPLMAGKGYALVVKPFDPKPTRPILLMERKIAVTPRQDTIRLAGTLELVGNDTSITRRRVDALVHGSRQYLNLPDEPQVVELWRGLRPCTPDGVPIIGRSRHLANLVLATGHQMVGLLTAPATGRLVADLVMGTKPAFDPTPFRPSRF